MSSSVIPVIVGVDIGGTNTDAVIIGRQTGAHKVLAEVKQLTTRDVNVGVKKAILGCLLQVKSKGHVVAPIQVNIGTTHFVNAVVQGKDLAKVAVIRICGPVSEELPPFSDFPTSLTNIICGSVHLVHGGFRYDGKEHEPMDEKHLRQIINDVKAKGIKNIAYIGIFSPTRPDQEIRAREITNEEFPEATVSLSHEIGHIGLLERENATILNECLKPLCKKTVSGFKLALEEIGLSCCFYLTQNDGTVISSEGVLEQPVLTFASGPTNSMRGATFLSELKDAIVVDIGGTTTDVGVLKNGFPREASSHVKIGGVRTNFRMPDVVSFGLGGGSYVTENEEDGKIHGRVTVGPLSSGLNLLKEAYVFSDGKDLSRRSLTATDIAVAKGLCKIGSSKTVENLDKGLVERAVDEIHRIVEELIDKIKLSKEELPVIVVGGGSVLMDITRILRGTTKLIIPEHFGVANAIGAALTKISASENTVINLLDMVDRTEMDKSVAKAISTVTDDPDHKKEDLATNEARKPFFVKARDEAMENICSKVKKILFDQGADKNTLEVLEKQDSVIAYMPGNATQIKVKIVGDLRGWDAKERNLTPWTPPSNSDKILSEESLAAPKQAYSVTGEIIDRNSEQKDDKDFTKCQRDPYIDPSTGEWILSEWDIECIVVGAGIYGCGGGASIHMGRLRCLRAISRGKKMRVVTPERLLQNPDPEKDIILVSAFIGAPLIMYEQGVSSHETTTAMECLKDIYETGGYKDGNIQNMDGAVIDTNAAGCKHIKDYRPTGDSKSEYKIVAAMSAEIGGMNAIEPFLIAANLDIPIVDGDGMSRAFPEVQMFVPYMLDKPPYPVGIVGTGNYKERSALLWSPGSKQTENYLRDVSIENGCSAGMAIPVDGKEVMTKIPLYTVSSAWRLGCAVLKARIEKESVIEAIMLQEDAKHIITGKVMDIQRETSGGFNRGQVGIEGVDDWIGHEIVVEFQNENLVIIAVEERKRGACLGTVPDLITIVDADTGEPVQTEEVKYGMRVAVLLMPSHDLLRQTKALRWVGPQAFHYPDDIQFIPFRQRKVTKPVPPV